MPVSANGPDGKLGRNYLMSELGDKINGLLYGAGHNIRIILKKWREMVLFFGLVCLGQNILLAAIVYRLMEVHLTGVSAADGVGHGWLCEIGGAYDFPVADSEALNLNILC